MTISILGDSFSADADTGSWIDLLSKNTTVHNYSQRGSSEYRIYQSMIDNLESIQQSDQVIVFHTNPDRIYVPNAVDYPTRKIPTHKTCDMLISDAFSNKSWRSIADVYYRHFFDQQYQTDMWQLMVDKINTVLTGTPVLNCTGFDIAYQNITSISDIKQQHPGNINHLDLTGNQAVYNRISQLI